MTTTIVVGCGATKAPYPATVRYLYTGRMFLLARRAADADGRPWVVLSALHGFLTPDEVVAPYDYTVTTAADHDRLVQTIQATAHKVVGPVEAWCPDRYVSAIHAAGIAVAAQPLRGLGVGHQRTWLASHIRANTPSLWSIT